MENLEPNVLAVLTTTGAALIMIVAGVHKRSLEWRPTRRRCAACGRRLTARICSCARQETESY